MAKKKNRKKVFLLGADDVYLTKKNIAVRRISTSTSNGVQVFKDTTRYYPRSKANMTALSRVYGHVRRGRK